jgi:hypothetical protein
VRHLVASLFKFLAKQPRCVLLDDDLCFEIRPCPVAEKLVILPGETIRTAVYASAIAIDRVSPSTFPIGGERFGYDLLGRGFLEDLELGQGRLAYIFS